MTIKLDESYFNPEKPTIMLFGQETNIFGNEKYKRVCEIGKNTNDAIGELMGFYQWFCKGIDYIKAYAFVSLYKKLIKQYGDEYNIIWNNLYKHSSYTKNNGQEKGERLEGKIDQKEYESIMEKQKRLLQTELELLNPSICIFLTGHDLDRSIAKLLDVSVEKGEIYQKGTVELILTRNSTKQQFKAIRTYHPSYLRRRGETENVFKYIQHFIESTKVEM